MPVTARRDGPAAIPPHRDGDALIEIRGLVVSYTDNAGGRVPVLDGVDLTVRRGEFLTLIGPSGCGKSSLLRCVGGLQPPQGGTIHIDGEPVTGPKPSRVAFVFQDFALFPWRTALENVEIALELGGVPRRERRPRALRALETVQLASAADRYPRELSGGMRQRVALARALAVDADVLLLDEPFGALDEQTRLVVGAELLRLLQGLGKTIVFVTHSLQEAAYLSDRVVVLAGSAGGIVETFHVGLPRPREPAMMSTPAFHAAYGELLRLLIESHGAPEEARAG